MVARLFGISLLAIGLGIIMNRDYYKKVISEMMKNTSGLLVWGLFALIVGLLIVIYHNVWVSSWEVLITIFGWIAIIKGAMIIVVPKSTEWFMDMYKKNSFFTFTGVLALVLGGVMCYFGFLV